MTARDHPVELDDSDLGDRLDVVLTRRLVDVPRRRAQYLIATGVAQVNGEPAVKSTRLEAGDRVTLSERVGPDFTPAPRLHAQVPTVAEDDWARILYKPPGVWAFGAEPAADDDAAHHTVAGHLVALNAASPEIGFERRRAGLVNVLEPSIGGLLVAAQIPRAYDMVRNQLFERRAEASLTLLVEGAPPAGPFTVTRREGALTELRLDLPAGALGWPIRLARPLLPQLRALLGELPIVGDDGEGPARVHLGRLVLRHRGATLAGEHPLPEGWPIGA